MVCAATRRCRTAFVAVCLALGLASCQSAAVWEDEARKVVVLAEIGPDATVADIGAGKGELAVSLAQRLGPNARIYATEVEPDLVETIRAAVAERNLANVTVIESTIADTGLPERCCDAIVLRTVYHHLTQPETMGVSLRRALKPGGRLLVIDFPPNPLLEAVAGAAGGREGHGVMPALVAAELEQAGLSLVRVVRDWNDDGWFAVLMRKPG